MPTRFAVALGSNQGDRVGHLRGAIFEMGGLGKVHPVSSLYETEPIGGPEQAPYLNAVAILETSLPPRELLEALQGIEQAHDRVRDVRWGPRTLDLDIVAGDGPPVKSVELEIPHPRAAERRFVLEPLSEIWPDADVGGVTASTALEKVSDQSVERLATRWAYDTEPARGRYWVLAQLVFFAAIALAIFTDGSLPNTEAWPLRVVGALVAIVGAFLAVGAVRALGSAVTIMPEPLPGARLVESGVYARARHPVYGGVSLIVIGTSLLLASRSGVALSLALMVFFWAKSGYEENQLRIAYPQYSAYRKRVRRVMIPGLL